MNRMKVIASKIYPYKKIADVGCDHGYLIIEALKLDSDIRAIAIDNKRMPLESCKSNMIKYGYLNNVRFSLSSGIEDIDEDTECVVIAGMGGILITEILSVDFKNVKRFILAPNKDEINVRKYMLLKGFDITDEEIVYENDKYYQIIVFDKVESNNLEYKYNLDELTYGPILMKKKESSFIDYMNFELSKYTKIIRSSESNIDKINNKIEMIRRILEC